MSSTQSLVLFSINLHSLVISSILMALNIIRYMRAKLLQSCLTLCDPWTIAHQPPLSIGFSSKNTGVGCHILLQRLFPNQELKPHLLCIPSFTTPAQRMARMVESEDSELTFSHRHTKITTNYKETQLFVKTATQWTWICTNFGQQWRTEEPGMLQSCRIQFTEQQQSNCKWE